MNDTNELGQDLLISTIVEGEATEGEWDALFATAENDASIWRAVVEAQRDQAALSRTMDRAGTVAACVPAPTPPVAPRRPQPASDRRHLAPPFGGRRAAWVGRTGWAVAAGVLLVWAVTLRLPLGGRPSPAPGAATPSPTVDATGAIPDTIPVGTARDAFDAYLAKGREEGTVLSATPRRVLLETRPLPEGRGFELIYLQQVMERTVVPDLFRVRGQDERGRPSLVRYEQPVRGQM